MTVTACSQPPEPALVLAGATMGTQWTVRLAGPLPAGLARTDLQQQVEALLAGVNDEMSTYQPDSLIRRFNDAAPGTEFTLTTGFATVLEAALALAQDTQGAFDPTVGPLVDLWGFGPGPAASGIPDAAAITAARARTGWQRVDYDPDSRRLRQPGGLHLDFSSIAKGHAVDQIAGLLLELGIENFLVDIGGDLRTAGRRADGEAWRVGIERPQAGARDVQRIVASSDIAMATSGSYRNYFASGGRRYGHTIDPRSGEPVQHQTVSVTVLAASCMEADALATALGVLPPDEALAFARERELAVLWLVEDNGGVRELETPAFTAMHSAGAR